MGTRSLFNRTSDCNCFSAT